MLTQKQVLGSLDNIQIPGVMRGLVDMNLVREVRVADGRVNITLAAAALTPEA